MATLSSEHKAFIVTMLARFEAPSDVQEAVNEEFGLEVSSSQIAYYNPQARSGNDRLADRWKELFEEQRRRYTEAIEDVAIAHERVRLEKLQKVVDDRMKHSDHRTVMRALEQAAKERGGAFTNVRDVQSKGEKVQPPDIYVYGGEEPDQEEAEDER